MYLDYPVISPWRWLAAIIIPILCALWGLKRKSVDISGALLGSIIIYFIQALFCHITNVNFKFSGFLMGFILTLTSFAHVACLMAFFFSSSKATKFRLDRKRSFEDIKNGGQRNWIQVLCNGGMASQLALLYLLDVGCGEKPIDFDKDYRSSWLSIGILGKQFRIYRIYFYIVNVLFKKII